MGLKEKVKQIKLEIPAVFLCLKSRETPLLAKIVTGIAVAYALSPIDLIPDFIPILGYLDDLIILPVLLTIAIKLIPREIYEDKKIEAQNILTDDRPKKWYYVFPIVAVWVLVLLIILKMILC